MIRWLARLQERRSLRWHAIEADAQRLLAAYGFLAYHEARERARTQAPPGRSRDRHWTAVALRIRALTDTHSGKPGF